MKNRFTYFIDKKLTRNIFLSIFVIIIWVIIYDLNRLYPIYIDDWDYSFIYYTNEKLNSLSDIFPSMTTHYLKWGGRIVVHSILQTMLLLGSDWADILNSLMFIGYLTIIYLISNKNCNSTRPSLFILIFIFMWFFQADMGETVLWLTGSANYLWGTSIILAFFYPYYKYLIRSENNITYKAPKNMKLRSFFFFFFGIIAGCTNENMIVALGCMIFIILYASWRRRKTIEKWTIWGIVGMSIGALFMFISPGNFRRYKMELKTLGFENAPGIEYYLNNIQILFNGTVKYLMIPLAIYMALLFIFILTNRDRSKIQILGRSLLLILGCTISIGAMAASPVFPARAWFGVISLFTVATAILYANLNFSKTYTHLITWLCIGVGSYFFVETYIEGRTELVKIRHIVDKREAEVNKQKAEGKKDIVLYDTLFEKKENLIIPKIYDFPTDPEHWMYKAYAHYHQVKSVTIITRK